VCSRMAAGNHNPGPALAAGAPQDQRESERRRCLTLFVSAVVALVQTILRFIRPHTLTELWWLAAAAGVIGRERLLQYVGLFADTESDAKNCGGRWRSRLVR
jgi:hypothetical protein